MVIHHDHVGFSLQTRDVSTYINQQVQFTTQIDKRTETIWSHKVQKRPLTKSKTSSWQKVLERLRIQRTYHNIIKATYKKSTDNMVWKREAQEISIKIRERLGCPLSPSCSIARAVRQVKQTGEILIGKEEVKKSFFTDYRVLYIKYPKDFTWKLL